MMLHILFMILRIIGIILLAVIGLILFLLLIVLFVPIRYEASAKKSDPVTVLADIRWILGLLHIHVSFDHKKLSFSVKILKKNLLNNSKSEDDKKNEAGEIDASREASDNERFLLEQEASEDTDTTEDELKEIKEIETWEESGQSDTPVTEKITEQESENAFIDFLKNEDCGDDTTDAHTDQDKFVKADADSHTDTSKISAFDRLKNVASGISAKVTNMIRQIQHRILHIQETIDHLKKKITFYQKFLTNKRTKAALAHGKKEGIYLLRHYLPKKSGGSLYFGFDDPASTGMVLGYLSAANALTGNKILLEADFEKKQLEGDFYFKGHIRSVHAVKAFLALLLDKNVRITIKRIRKMRK